jgi:hypothetical protein
MTANRNHLCIAAVLAALITCLISTVARAQESGTVLSQTLTLRRGALTPTIDFDVAGGPNGKSPGTTTKIYLEIGLDGNVVLPPPDPMLPNTVRFKLSKTGVANSAEFTPAGGNDTTTFSPKVVVLSKGLENPADPRGLYVLALAHLQSGVPANTTENWKLEILNLPAGLRVVTAVDQGNFKSLTPTGACTSGQKSETVLSQTLTLRRGALTPTIDFDVAGGPNGKSAGTTTKIYLEIGLDGNVALPPPDPMLPNIVRFKLSKTGVANSAEFTPAGGSDTTTFSPKVVVLSKGLENPADPRGLYVLALAHLQSGVPANTTENWKLEILNLPAGLRVITAVDQGNFKSLTPTGVCGVQCPAGQVCCGGNGDRNNCTGECKDVCGVQCPAGQPRCCGGNQNPANCTGECKDVCGVPCGVGQQCCGGNRDPVNCTGQCKSVCGVQCPADRPECCGGNGDPANCTGQCKDVCGVRCGGVVPVCCGRNEDPNNCTGICTDLCVNCPTLGRTCCGSRIDGLCAGRCVLGTQC